jgi:uncharacterized coiled-coil protein SlyX
MRTDGWIPLSDRKPTQEELDRGVWWIKSDWKKAAFKTWVCINNLPHNQDIWSWRMDPLPPEPPQPPKLEDWEAAMKAWWNEDNWSTARETFKAGWYAAVVRHESTINDHCKRMFQTAFDRGQQLMDVRLEKMEFERRIRELESELKTANDTALNLSKVNGQYFATISDQNRQLKTMRDLVEAKDKEIANFKSQLDHALNDNELLGRRAVEFVTEINALNIECKRLKREINILTDDRATLKNNFEKAIIHCEQVKQQLADAKSVLEYLNLRGGLGLDIHEKINATLSKISQSAS